MYFHIVATSEPVVRRWPWMLTKHCQCALDYSLEVLPTPEVLGHQEMLGWLDPAIQPNFRNVQSQQSLSFPNSLSNVQAHALFVPLFFPNSPVHAVQRVLHRADRPEPVPRCQEGHQALLNSGGTCFVETTRTDCVQTCGGEDSIENTWNRESYY